MVDQWSRRTDQIELETGTSNTNRFVLVGTLAVNGSQWSSIINYIVFVMRVQACAVVGLSREANVENLTASYFFAFDKDSHAGNLITL